jgi:hypothetical protein
MKKEYDFSKGERSQFYRKGLVLNLPVYLDKKHQDSVQRIAARKKRDVLAIVNELIRLERKTMEIME